MGQAARQGIALFSVRLEFWRSTAVGFRRFEEHLARLLSRQSGETAALRRRIELNERRIRNCTEAIACMGLSNSLRAQLTDLETEHRDLTEKLAGAEPR